VAYFVVNNGNTELASKYYMDYAHDAVMADAYNAGDDFYITVQYEWLGSPHKDFTVKVYSAHADTPITDYDTSNSNMLYTDG
jgi:hypothetical protein